MREKILAQLVSKYAGVSKNALGLLADKLAKKVTEESGIEQAITDLDNAYPITEFAADLQREADRRVGDAKKEWEKKNPPTPPKLDNPPINDPPKPDEMPAWAKTLVDQVANLTKEKAHGTIQAKAKELLKDVPEVIWKGRALPENEDGLDGFVQEVTKDYNDYKQDQINKGLMSATPPAGSGDGKPSGGGDKKAIDANIVEWAKEIKGPQQSSDKK